MGRELNLFCLEEVAISKKNYIFPRVSTQAFISNFSWKNGRLLGFPLKGTREWSSCSREIYGIYQERRNRRKIKKRDNAHEGALQAHGYWNNWKWPSQQFCPSLWHVANQNARGNLQITWQLDQPAWISPYYEQHKHHDTKSAYCASNDNTKFYIETGIITLYCWICGIFCGIWTRSFVRETTLLSWDINKMNNQHVPEALPKEYKNIEQ